MSTVTLPCDEVRGFRTLLREMVRELGMLNRTLHDTGLSPLQSHILIELGQRPLGVTELARLLCAEKSSISRTLRSLTDNELLARQEDDRDRRASVFLLTEKGQHVLQDVHLHADQHILNALALSSESEQRAMVNTAKTLTAALRSARHQEDARIALRPIQPKDDPAIQRVIVRSFEENGIAHLEGVSLHDPALGHLSHAYALPRAGYWVATQGGRVIGGVGIAPLAGADDQHCEMQKLYLDSQFAGMGIGRRLIAHALREARAFGYRYCYLETLNELSSAVGLYRTFGFEYCARLGHTGHGSCDICMLKVLE